MPELPEVTTISNQLKKELTGKVISSVSVNVGYKVHPSNEEFLKWVTRSTIEDVGRIAKVIVIIVGKSDARRYISIHLAMTGRLRFWRSLPNQESPQTGDSLVEMRFEGGTSLVFTDVRRFGYVKLLNEGELKVLKAKYGPDPLSVDLKSFSKNIRSRRTNIKNALLDQSLISGIGNIYANDALFMAKIHPKVSTGDLTIQQFNNLLSSIRQILYEGIEHRGSTLGDLMYTDIYGFYGEHQNYFRIYGKSFCSICKSKLEFMVLNSRGTYFCPVCQKEDSPDSGESLYRSLLI